MSPRSQAAAADRPLLGITLMVVAVLAITLLDSSAKYLADDYAMPQLLWARYTFSFLFTLVALPRIGWSGLVCTRQPFAQLGRGALLLLATGAMFMAVRYMPIADAYAISFVSPAIVALFAIPLLSESVTRRRWLAIVCGFAGVVMVIRPGTTAATWAAIFPLAMAMFYALYQIMTRKLGPQESPFTTLFYTMVLGAAITTCVAPFVWRAPTAEAWAIMIWMGLIGLLGQLALIKAFALAPASLLSPFVYTQIIWGILVGYAVFGDTPDTPTVFGTLIVVASGLFLMQTRGSARPGWEASLPGSSERETG